MSDETAECPECDEPTDERDNIFNLWMCDDCGVGFDDNGNVVAR